MTTVLVKVPPAQTEIDAVVAACRAEGRGDPLGHFPGQPPPEAAFGAVVGGTDVVSVALLIRERSRWSLAVATRRTAFDRLAENSVMQAALDHVDRTEPGQVQMWVPRADPVADERAFAWDFVLSRRLLRLEVEFDRVSPAPWPQGFELDTARDADLARLVAVNNAAFAWHEDQGEWTVEELAARIREDWVDRDGFLVARTPDGDVAGFCWTKVHREPELIGEIFVICADPGVQGKGLGSALTGAGLAHLSSRSDRGMLYVDDGNIAARRTYRRLGFTLAGVHTRYTRDLGLLNRPFSGLV